MKKIYLLWAILSPICVYASNENQQAGARAFSMGQASVALIDEWSAFNNQAAIALLDKNSLAAYYENRFSNKDLSTKAFNLCLNNKLGSFGICYSQFGFNLYKESKIGFTYAHSLGKHFWTGIQLDQLRKKLNVENGSQNRYVFEIGLLSEISKGFFLGVQISNPTQEKFSAWEQEDRIPTLGRFGFMWKLSKEAIITSEIQKELNGSLQVKGGMEYSVNKRLFLRTGVHNHPNSISMGIGLNFDLLQTNIAFAKHPVLGYTPTADLSFKF